MTPHEQSYREIQLTKGQVTRVSPEDFEWASDLKWSALWNPFTKSYYAITVESVPGNKSRLIKYLHRMILGLERGDRRQADHIDRNTLNNTRQNLRVATQRQNSVNAKLRCDNTSGFKGVYARKDRKNAHFPWFSMARVNGKNKYLGSFKTREDASQAYIQFCSDIHGEFFRSS